MMMEGLQGMKAVARCGQQITTPAGLRPEEEERTIREEFPADHTNRTKTEKEKMEESPTNHAKHAKIEKKESRSSSGFV